MLHVTLGKNLFFQCLANQIEKCRKAMDIKWENHFKKTMYFFGGGGLLLSFLMFNFSSFLFPIIYLSFPEKKNKTCTCLKNPRFLLFFSVSFGLSHPLLPLLKVYLAVLAVHTYIHHRFMDQEDLEF